MSYLTEGILVSHVTEAEFTQSSYTNGTSALLVNLYVFFIVLILVLHSYVLIYNLKLATYDILIHICLYSCSN